jgi:filamin
LAKLDKDSEGGRINNCNNAFDQSEQNFGIAHLLDAEDTVKSPDELSVMSYVSLFRAYLGSVTPAAEHCSAEGPGLTEAICKEKAFFKVITRNEEKELIKRGGANVQCYITGADGKKNRGIVKDKLDGTYECYYIVNTPGTYDLEVIVAQKPIQGSPFHPEARAGGPSALQCEAHGAGVEKVTAGAPAEFVIKTRDERGNEITEGGATFNSTFQDKAGNITVSITDNKDGTYTGSYTAKTAGKTPLIILLKEDDGDKDIKNSPYQVLVLPGPLDASQVEVSGKGLEIVVAGETAEFVATAKDGFGNKLINGGNKLSVKVSGAADVPTTTADNNDGTYKATYVPTVVGDYHVAVDFDGNTIPRSPFPVKVVPAAANAAHTEASGEGIKEATAGHAAPVKVQTKDQFGNKLNKGGDKITAALTPKAGGEAVPVSVKDNGDGTYDLAYEPKEAGDYTLDIKLDGNNIKDAPFAVTVHPGSLDAGNVDVSGNGIKEVVAGETADVHVQAKDNLGNKLNKGGNALNVKVAGPGEAAATVADNNDGSYKATYVPTVTGDYKVHVEFDGKEVKNSPFAVKVVPASGSAANTVAEGDGLQKATAGAPEKIHVQVKDRFDNKVVKGGDAVAAKLHSGEKEVPVEVKDNNDGTYSLTYDAKEAGEYTLDITLGGENIKDSPFHPVVSPAGNDPSQTEITGDGLKTVVAGETGNFHAQAKDHLGNKLQKGGNALTAKFSADNVPVDVKDNGDGTYNGSYVPTVTGEFKLDVHFDGKEVPHSPFTVTVVPAAPDAKHTEAHGDGLHNAKAGEPNGFKVQVKDRFGNKVTQGGAPITASVTDKSDPESSGPAEVHDNGDGTYDVKYPAIEKAGDYVIDVKLGADDIKDAPFALKVAPNDHVESGNCYVEGVANSVAGVPVTVTVHSVDSFGNHSTIGGAKVAVALSGADNLDAEVKDNGDGTYSASYTPTVAGDYTIDVKVNDAAVKENPFKVTVSPDVVDPIHCVAEGHGLSKAKVAKEASFKIFLKDRFDNKVPFKQGTVAEASLVAEGQEPVVAAVKSNGDDTFTGSYKVRRPGKWVLTIKVNAGEIKGNPFSVPITPGAVHVPNSTVDKKDGVAGKPGTRITLQDVEGNKRHKGGQKIKAVFERPLAQTGGARDNGDGTFDLIYPADAKGDYKVKVFVGDDEVPGGAMDISVGEHELDEDTQKAVAETLPSSGETVARLLKQATDEERAALVADLSALKSGVSPSDGAAAAENDKLKQNLEVMQAKEAKLKEHNKQLEEQLAAAQSAAPAAAPAPVDDGEKDQLKNEVAELKQQLEAAKAAPAPAAAASSNDEEKATLQKELEAVAEEKKALAKKAEEAEAERTKAAEINEYLQKKLADAEAALAAAKSAPAPAAEPAAEPKADVAAPVEDEDKKPKKRSSKKDVKADIIEKKPEPEAAPVEEAPKSSRKDKKDKKSTKEEAAPVESPKGKDSKSKSKSKSKK